MCFETDRFVDQEIAKNLVCSICQGVLCCPQLNKQEPISKQEPMRASAKGGHKFCANCIMTWLNKQRNCPDCRELLNEEDLQPLDIFASNMLKGLKIRCKYNQNGCLYIDRLEVIENHEMNCQFGFSKCDRCGLKYPYRELHSKDDCINALVKILKEKNTEIESRDQELQKLKNENTLEKKIRKALSSAQYERKNIGFSPAHCVVLPNSNILYSSISEDMQNKLTIFDLNFNRIKTISQIEGENLVWMAGITLDNFSIYLADYGNNKIIKTDFELYSLKKKTDVESPLALAYNNNNIFVTQQIRCIKRLSTNLIQLNEYNLDFIPRNMKILNDTVFFRPFEENFMCFFQITDAKLNLKKKIDGHNGIIGNVDSMFLEFDNSTGIMYRYNSFGDLIEEMVSNIHDECQGSIMYANNKLIIPLYHGELIILKLDNF